MEIKSKLLNVWQKIRSKNNIAWILPLIIVLNFIPLIILNYNTQTSLAAGMDTLVPAYGAGCILLVICFMRKPEISKSTIIEFVLLALITIMWGVVQYINYKNGTFLKMDLYNIACKVFNIFFLFIMCINLKCDEKAIYWFMRILVVFGIISCVFNFYLYGENILAQLNITGVEANKNIVAKSFFAQKNQFALFLYTAIIADVFLLIKDNKWYVKILLLAILGFFVFNLIFTESRTGLIIVAAFLGLMIVFNDRVKLKIKIPGLVILSIIAIIGIQYAFKYHSDFIEEKLIRKDSIKTFSSRTSIWQTGWDLLAQKPENKIVGIGRFQGTTILEEKFWQVTQFHNSYMEYLISGGIIEVIYVISIYLFIIIKMFRSNLDKRYKIMYTIMYLTFFVYMMQESLCRFSIGGSDMLILICLVTVPLLHINSDKEKNISNQEIGKLAESTTDVDNLEEVSENNKNTFEKKEDLTKENT